MRTLHSFAEPLHNIYYIMLARDPSIRLALALLVHMAPHHPPDHSRSRLRNQVSVRSTSWYSMLYHRDENANANWGDLGGIELTRSVASS